MSRMSPVDPAPALTSGEDGTLRRLRFFEVAGAVLAPPLGQLVADLRSRDQRLVIRDPDSILIRIPTYP